MKRPLFSSEWPESWRNSYHYDELEVYNSSTNLSYSLTYQARFKVTTQLITQLLKPNSSILDVAAAQGNFSLWMAEQGYRVTWNDLRNELIDYVKLKYEKGSVDFKPGNIFELQFENSFDCVLATEVIEHVAHPDQFLTRLASFLKPGGKIILSTPNGDYIRNKLPSFFECPDPSVYETVQFKPDADGHIFLLHSHELETLAQQAGLKIRERHYFANPLMNGHLKLRHLLPYLPRSIVSGSQKLVQVNPGLERKLSIGIAVALEKQ